MEVTPPSYTYPGLPVYSLNALPNESSITNSNVPNSTGHPLQEYQYKSGSLKINLGPKRSGLFRPTYGWNDVVEGYVEVKKNTKKVLSIVVVVEGQVTTGHTERGFLVDQTRKTVFQLSHTLYDSSSGEPLAIDGVRYSFSFPLPSYCTGGSLPLPPSFSVLRTGIAVDISYFIRVEMVRKGKLRQNERLKAFFYYLPRTYAPSPRSEMSSFENRNDKPAIEGQDEWETFRVLPRISQCTVHTAASDLGVWFALPRSLIFALGCTIPFHLTIKSHASTEAISALFTTLSVQHVRVTTLRARSRCSTHETVLGGGQVFRIEEQGDERVMWGNVPCSRTGGSSWHADEVEIKHLVRIKLSPRGDVPSLAYTLPGYLLDILITMKTHQQTENGIEDATSPALCLLPHPMSPMYDSVSLV
ncbi:hypothetical protein K439DRAFT_362484 [Ramaria rubella]|nr:hypothetical protein K439DRAFT_362484 [Ramaria rubella]